MSRILAISSEVVHGHVGLSAVVPTLQRLGHEVLALPTVLLSNHPGYARVAGMRLPPDLLGEIVAALDANGRLAGVDAVLSGYLPTAAHVELACDVLKRVRLASPTALFLCDPILGDDPKGLYVDISAAEAVRTHLAGACDVLTPNRFDLAWLSGHPVETWREAVAAAKLLAAPVVIATSIPGAAGELMTLAIRHDGVSSCSVGERERVPHGTGDLLAALYLAHILARRPNGEALARSVAGVEAAIAGSTGRDELDLAATLDDLVRAEPLPVEALT